MPQQPPGGQGFRNHEVSRPHSVGLLWTGDQPNAETSTWWHTTLTKDRLPHSPESNPQSQQASGRRPTPYPTRPLGPSPLHFTRSIKPDNANMLNSLYLRLYYTLFTSVHSLLNTPVHSVQLPQHKPLQLQLPPINPNPRPYLRVTWIRTLLYPGTRGRR